MSNVLEFIGIIQGNGITAPPGMKAYFYAHQDKQVKVRISENIKNRSLKQNSYYWGVILPHARQFRADNGDVVSLEHMHEDLIQEFSPCTEVQALGCGFVGIRHKRTKEMDKKEFTEYCTAIAARLAEFGYALPVN